MDILFQSTTANPHQLTVSIANPDWTPVAVLDTQEKHLWVYGKAVDIAPAVADALNIPFTVGYRTNGVIAI